jgi:tRNA(fMet)-specific endonuclease VapC
MSTLSRLLLDTNIVIHLIRGDTTGQAVDSRFHLLARPDRPLVSVVTLGEALAFAHQRNWGTERIARLRDLMRELVPVNISPQPILVATRRSTRF